MFTNNKKRIAMFGKMRPEPNVCKDRAKIPMSGRIRPEFKCFEEQGQNFNVSKDNVRIPRFEGMDQNSNV